MSRLGAAGTIHLLWPSLAGLVLTATINLAPARVANASEGKPPAACRAQVKELSKWLTAYVRGLDSHPDFILVP